MQAAFRHPVTIATTAQRTGKTGTICAFHRYQAKHNPGVLGFAVVESFKWYRRVMHRVCKELFGHEAKYNGQDFVWTWGNGAQLMILSYEQIDSWEGGTGGWGTIDESQNVGKDAYEVLLSRLSDNRAKFLSVLICGLPTFDSWADSLAESNPAYAHFANIGTDVNSSNVHTLYLDRLKETLSPEEYNRRVRGFKPYPAGRVFQHFLPELFDPSAANEGGNLVRHKYDPKLRTILGVDFGRKASIVFAQETEDEKLIFFKEIQPESVSTEAWASALLDVAVPRNLAKTGDRRILVDEICADPAGNNWQSAEAAEDIARLRECFGAEVRFTYERKFRSIRFGILLMQGMILNAAGKRRLLIDWDLWHNGLKVGPKGRSLAMSIVRTKYPEDADGKAISEEPIKGGLDDHCLDATRYLIVNKRGRKQGGVVSIR